MDTTLVFLATIALIAANQAVLRIATLRASPWAFWGLQAVNLAVACWLLVWGLPGFVDFPLVSWILGLLLIFRIVQNNMLRARFLRQAQEDARLAEKRQRAKDMADALARQEAGEVAGPSVAVDDDEAPGGETAPLA